MKSAVCLALLFATESFDVASVKPSRPGVNGYAAMRLSIEPRGRRFTAADAPLRDLIMLAYGVSDRQVLGGPAWLSSEGFDIEAKTEQPSNPEQIRLMLRALLAERFMLRLTSETKQLKVDALVTGKNNLGLRSTVSPGNTPSIAIRAANARTISVAGTNVSMAFTAAWLSGKLHRIVADKTGLDGSFDFAVEIALDPDDARDPNLSERDVITHIFAALPEKLGLKLQQRSEPIETLTIEHAERPSEN